MEEVETLRPRDPNKKHVCKECGQPVSGGAVTDHMRRHHQLTIAQYRLKYNIPSQSHNRDLVMKKAWAGASGQVPHNKKYATETVEITCCICGGKKKRPSWLVATYAAKGITTHTCGKRTCISALSSKNIRKAKNTPEAKARVSTNSKKMWADGHRTAHVRALVAGTHSFNTKPEVVMQGFLKQSGIKFSTHEAIRLPSMKCHCIPDILVGMVAIFMDGCYWHNCKECGFEGRNPKADRDPFITSALQALGYTVVRIWEHELKGEDWKAKLAIALNI